MAPDETGPIPGDSLPSDDDEARNIETSLRFWESLAADFARIDRDFPDVLCAIGLWLPPNAPDDWLAPSCSSPKFVDLCKPIITALCPSSATARWVSRARGQQGVRVTIVAATGLSDGWERALAAMESGIVRLEQSKTPTDSPGEWHPVDYWVALCLSGHTDPNIQKVEGEVVLIHDPRALSGSIVDGEPGASVPVAKFERLVAPLAKASACVAEHYASLWREDWEDLCAESSVGTKLPDEANGGRDEAMLHVAALAEMFGVDPEALRKRLERWRDKNQSGWIEAANPVSREPKYLYQVGTVRPIAMQLRASAEASVNRPTKK